MKFLLLSSLLLLAFSSSSATTTIVDAVTVNDENQNDDDANAEDSKTAIAQPQIQPVFAHHVPPPLPFVYANPAPAVAPVVAAPEPRQFVGVPRLYQPAVQVIPASPLLNTRFIQTGLSGEFITPIGGVSAGAQLGGDSLFNAGFKANFLGNRPVVPGHHHYNGGYAYYSPYAGQQQPTYTYYPASGFARSAHVEYPIYAEPAAAAFHPHRHHVFAHHPVLGRTAFFR